MKLIELSAGQFTKVDDEDFMALSNFAWSSIKKISGFYAVRQSSILDGSRRMYLHREIMPAPPGMVVDHINHDTLDNRKGNLRLCTSGQNNSHRKGAQKNSKSGIRGVFWHKLAGKWRAGIRVNGRTIHLGLFVNKSDAAAAYAAANREHFGEFGGGL